MINEAVLIIVAFAIGWWCHAILLRFGKPLQDERPRRSGNSRTVQLKRPTSHTVSPWVGPARAAATTETRELQRLRAKLAAASEVCEVAGRGQQLRSVLAELDGGKS
jgi:hypothetical protein